MLYTTSCDKVCQCLATGRWFSPGAPVSSNNKTDCHDIADILLKMTLNTITLTSCITVQTISGEMTSVLALSVVNHGFDPQSGKT